MVSSKGRASEPRKDLVTLCGLGLLRVREYSLKENNNSAQLVLRLKAKEVGEAMWPSLKLENGWRPQDNLVHWECQAAHECS